MKSRETANAFGLIATVGCVVLVLSLFAYSGCEDARQKREAEEQRIEQQRQRELERKQKALEARVAANLAEISARRAKRTYEFGTARSMLRALTTRNPSIDKFLRKNPDKRTALLDFLKQKAKAGFEFDLRWDDGDHYFRKAK